MNIKILMGMSSYFLSTLPKKGFAPGPKGRLRSGTEQDSPGRGVGCLPT